MNSEVFVSYITNKQSKYIGLVAKQVTKKLKMSLYSSKNLDYSRYKNQEIVHFYGFGLVDPEKLTKLIDFAPKTVKQIIFESEYTMDEWKNELKD